MVSQVQNAGLANITSAIDAYGSKPQYIGWGTGSAVAVSATNLAVPANESRTTGSTSQQTSTATNDTYRVTGTIVATGTRAITEAGVFDAAGTGNPPTGGNLDFYGDFTVINLSTSDSIAFTFDVTFASA